MRLEVDDCRDCPLEWEGSCAHPRILIEEYDHCRPIDWGVQGREAPMPPAWCPLRDEPLTVALAPAERQLLRRRSFRESIRYLVENSGSPTATMAQIRALLMEPE